MRYNEILNERWNGTWQNALVKMAQGYVYGRSIGNYTCYAYVGEELAKLKPEDAIIRFWGIKKTGSVVHGDAVLPDGHLISTIPLADYEHKAEIVHTLSLDQFKDWLEQSLKLTPANELSPPSTQSHSDVPG